MRRTHLPNFILMILLFGGILACKKFNFVDPDIKKKDTVEISTKVRRIEKFNLNDSTYYTLTYKADGTVDSLITEVYRGNILSAKTVRLFKEAGGKLKSMDEYNLYPNTSHTFVTYEYGDRGIAKIINESVVSTYYYNTEGYLDYVLMSNGDSTDVLETDTTREVTSFMAEHIARQRAEGKTVIDYWSGKAWWEVRDGKYYYSTASNGYGLSQTLIYSDTQSPVPGYVWRYISNAPEFYFAHVPSWLPSSHLELQVQYLARYKPKSDFTYVKDKYHRLTKVNVSNTADMQQPYNTSLNLYY